MSVVRLRPGVLARLRRAADLSQPEVARRLEGLRREQNLGDWERERQQPQPRFIPLLASVFGVNPLELLDVDVDDPPLQALRLAAGLSLVELESLTGISRTTYYRLESGSRKGELDPVTATALAGSLKVDVERVARAAQRSRQA